MNTPHSKPTQGSGNDRLAVLQQFFDSHLATTLIALMGVLYIGIAIIHFASAGTVTLEVGPGQTYATIQAAVDAIPADLVTDDNSYIVNVHASTYTEEVTVEGFTTDATHTITIQANTGDTAIMDGSSLGGGPIAFTLDDQSYVTISGFEIHDYTNGITLGGASDFNIVSDNTIYNNGYDGVHAAGIGAIVFSWGDVDTDAPDDNTFSNNIMHNNGLAAVGTVTVNNPTTDADNNVFEYNTIYSHSFFGFALDEPGTVIRNNLIYDNTFGAQVGLGTLFENNTVYGNICNGVIAASTSALEPAVIQNNIFSNNAAASGCNATVTSLPAPFHLYPLNNDNGYGAVAIDNTGVQDDVELTNNLFYNNGWNVDDGNEHVVDADGSLVVGTIYSTAGEIDAINASLPGVIPTDNITGLDPQFTDPDGADNVLGNANGADDNFTLQSSSPAINAGDSASAFANEPAPNGSRINMGAYGNTASAATSSNVAPTTRDTSGTAWAAPTLVNNGNGSISVSSRLSNEASPCTFPSTQTNYPAGVQYSLDGGTTWNYTSNFDNENNPGGSYNCTTVSLGDLNTINFDLLAEIGPGSAGTVDVRIRPLDTVLMATQWTAAGSVAYNFNNIFVVDQNDPGCSDLTGTPYCTIQAAVSDVPAVPADPYLINVYSGTYNENVTVSGITTTVTNTLTIQEAAGESVIVDGTGLGGIAIGFHVDGVDYVTIEGFEVQNFGSAGIKYDVAADNGIIRGNVVHNNGSGDGTSGIWLGNSTGAGQGSSVVQILDNELYANEVGLIVSDDSTSNTISGNTIYSNNGQGIREWSNGGTSNTYSGNTVYSNDGIGVHISISNLPLPTHVFDHNLVYDNNGNGFYSNDGSITYTNNTIYSNSLDGIQVQGNGTHTIRNNIFSSNGGEGVAVVPDVSQTIDATYNLFFGDTLDGASTQSAINTLAYASDNIVFDPRFTDPDGADNILGGSNGADDDFTEGSLAPTIDAGDPTDAFANEPAPNGSRINIGAYGNTASAATTPADSLRFTDSGGSDITQIYHGQTIYVELVKYGIAGTASTNIDIFTTAGDKETIALTPSIGPGVFTGSIQFAQTAPTQSNGTLEGSVDDILRAHHLNNVASLDDFESYANTTALRSGWGDLMGSLAGFADADLITLETGAGQVPPSLSADQFLEKLIRTANGNNMGSYHNPSSVYLSPIDLTGRGIVFDVYVSDNTAFGSANIQELGYLNSVVYENFNLALVNGPGGFDGSNSGSLNVSLAPKTFQNGQWMTVAVSQSEMTDVTADLGYVGTYDPTVIRFISFVPITGDNTTGSDMDLGLDNVRTAEVVTDTIMVIATPVQPVRITDSGFNDITSINNGQSLYFEVNDLLVAGAGSVELEVTTTAGDTETISLSETSLGQFRSAAGLPFVTGAATSENGTLEGVSGGSVDANYYTPVEGDDFESYADTTALQAAWDDPLSGGGPAPILSTPGSGAIGSAGPSSDLLETKFLESNINGGAHVAGGGATSSTVNANFSDPIDLSGGRKLRLDVYVSDTGNFYPGTTTFGGAVTVPISDLFVMLVGPGSATSSGISVPAASLTSGGWTTLTLDPTTFTDAIVTGSGSLVLNNINGIYIIAITSDGAVPLNSMDVGIDNLAVLGAQTDTVSIPKPDGMYITDSSFVDIISVALGSPISFEYVSAASAGDGTVVITVTTSSGDTETLTLTEVGSSGVFRRQNVSTADASINDEDGTIQVSPNGTITATLGPDNDSITALLDNVLRITDASYNSVDTVYPGDDLYFELSKSSSAGSVLLVADITSTSGGTETVTLDETGPSTGIFRSSVPLAALATGDVNAADSILNISNGDTITATFTIPGAATIDDFELYLAFAAGTNPGAADDVAEVWTITNNNDPAILSIGNSGSITAGKGNTTQFLEKFVNAAGGSNDVGMQIQWNALSTSTSQATTLNFGSNGPTFDFYVDNRDNLSTTGFDGASGSLPDPLIYKEITVIAVTEASPGQLSVRRAYVSPTTLTSDTWNTITLSQSDFASYPSDYVGNEATYNAATVYDPADFNWNQVDAIFIVAVNGDADGSIEAGENDMLLGFDNFEMGEAPLIDTATVAGAGLRITDSGFANVSTVQTGDTVYFEYTNTSSAGTGSVDITIATTVGDSETVTLTETPANSGRFRGSMALAQSASPTAANGTLEAQNADIVTASFQTYDFYDDFEAYSDLGGGTPGTPIHITSLTGGYGWLETNDVLFGGALVEPVVTVGDGTFLIPSSPTGNQFLEKQADTTAQDVGILLEAAHGTVLPGGVPETNMTAGLTFDAYVTDAANIDFVTGTIPPLPPLKGFFVLLASNVATPSMGAVIHYVPAGSVPDASWFTVGPLDPTTVWADEATLISSGDVNTDFINGNSLFGTSGTFDPTIVSLVAFGAIVGPGDGSSLPLPFSTLTMGVDNIKSPGAVVQDTATVTVPAPPAPSGGGGSTPPPAGGSDTPSAPTPLTPQGINTSTVRWNFRDNASNEVGFTLFDNNTQQVATANTPDLTYLEETGLQANTAYTGRSVIALGPGGANSAQAFWAQPGYTAIESPQSINAELTLDTMIRVSANASGGQFTNLNAGMSGLLFENVTKGTSSGWIKTNLWDSPDLTPGQAYTFRVTARNGNGDATSSVETVIIASGQPQPILSLVMGVGINIAQLVGAAWKSIVVLTASIVTTVINVVGGIS